MNRLKEQKSINNTEILLGPRILYYGILLIFLLEYARIGNYIYFINNIKANVFVPIIIFLFTIFSTTNKSQTTDYSDNVNIKLILFFLTLIVISTLTSDVSILSQEILSACTGYFILYYIINQNINTISKLYGLFFILILCHIFLIIMNFDVVSDPTTRTYIRNNPFMGDGNDFSLSLCITIPLCLFLFNNVDRKINKAIYFSFFILMFLAIIGNSSRGGTLAILCILLYYGIKSQNKIKFVFFILLMSCLVFVYAPPSYYNRIEHINNWQEPSAQGRVNAWKGAIQMASDHPFLGIGAGHFPIKYASDYQIGKEYIEKKTAHSMYFLALGELGFPGFIIIIYLIIFNFLKNEKLIKLIKKSNIDNRKENLSLIIHLNASLVGFSVAALFLSVLYYPHIFVLAGIFDSARRIVNERLYHDKYLPEDENEYLSISVNKFSNTHSLS